MHIISVYSFSGNDKTQLLLFSTVPRIHIFQCDLSRVGMQLLSALPLELAGLITCRNSVYYYSWAFSTTYQRWVVGGYLYVTTVSDSQGD